MKKVLLNSLILGVMLLFGGLTQAYAQRTISGTVRDASSNTALPGVNVRVPHTSIGTATDENGKYSLTVPANADSLEYTYIGYDSKTVAIGNRTSIDVALKPQIEQFESVVVTALGVKRQQRSLGYSSQSISTQNVDKNPATNFVNNLQGKIAGVNITNSQGTVGSSTRIVLRGVSTLTGNNQPVFVVDGVIMDNSTFSNPGAYGGGQDYGNAIMDLNPDNIASITVLKGANAAALYGSRAANGAIIITTKSGSVQGQRGLGININSTVTFQTVSPQSLPVLQNVYGQGGYGQFAYVDGAGGGINDGQDESWGPKMSGQKKVQFFTNGNMAPWIAHPGNIKSYFNTGSTINNNFSVAGSNGNSNYRLSFENDNQTGTIPNSSLGRTNVSLATGLQLSKKLHATGNVTYIHRLTKNVPSVGYDSFNPMEQLTEWIGRQVDMNILRNYIGSQNVDGSYNEFNWNYNYHNNPFWETYMDRDRQTRDRVFGRVQLSYDLTPSLNIRGYSGVDTYSELRKRLIATAPNDGASAYNSHGYYDEYHINNTDWTSDLIATFNKDVSPSLNVNAKLGAESVLEEYNTLDATATQLSIPGVFNLGNSAVPVNPSNTLSRKKTNSVYGEATFGFRNWLFLDLTGRNDWSSTLPKKNDSYFYPSASLSWVFTDALNLKSSWLNYGKLRASWASVGNDTNPYQLQVIYQSQGQFNGVPEFSIEHTLPNLNLKPEKIYSLELGGELRGIQNRVGLDVTYYRKATKDQILPVRISGASGFTNQYINAGEIDNNGVEVTLNLTPVQTSNFSWDWTFNWAKNNNKVISLAPGVNTYVMNNAWGITMEARPGYPVGTFFGPGYKYNSKGQLEVGVYQAGDEANPNASDPSKEVGYYGAYPLSTGIKSWGSYQPKWTGSISTTASYKNLSLSVLVDVKHGGEVYSVTNMFGNYTGILKSTLNGRQIDWNNPGFVPKNAVVGDNGGLSNFTVGQPFTTPTLAEDWAYNAYYGYAQPNIFDASYVKLRRVELTYTMPRKWIAGSPFSSIQLSLVGNNLWIIHKNAPNIDPETAFGNGNNVQGFESNQIPSVRSVGFDIRLSL